MATRLRLVAPVLCGLGLTLSACGMGNNVPVNLRGSGTATAAIPNPTAVVLLKYVSFEPATVTVHVGQTVEWKWDDGPIVHNVTFSDFASSTRATGTYFHTFDEPGVYQYRSTINDTMTGTVQVLP